MKPDRSSFTTFALTLLGVVLLELIVTGFTHSISMVGTGGLILLRSLETLFLLWMNRRNSFPGIKPSAPLIKRLVPAFVLCFLMFAGAVIVDSLHLLQLPISIRQSGDNIVGFFLAACVASPLAEELFFRGAVFGYFRRFGFLPALLVSSLLFSTFHGSGWSIPLLPLLGGILFACAYEQSRTMVSPVLLHSVGNFLLFFFLAG